MIILNMMAQSLDGKIAANAQESTSERYSSGFTNAWDQNLLLQEIEAADAIIIGAQSLRTEGTLLESSRNPPWYIYSRKGLKPSLPFWSQNLIPRTLVSPKPLGPMPDPQVANLVYPSPHEAVSHLLKELKQRGAQRVLLLGGQQVNTLFYEQNAVDEIKLTISPTFLGQGGLTLGEPALKTPQMFHLLSIERHGDFVNLHYKKKD